MMHAASEKNSAEKNGFFFSILFHTLKSVSVHVFADTTF